VREKYCWLAGGWWLVLNWCERKALLAGWEPAEQGLNQSFCQNLTHKTNNFKNLSIGV
jgi:hypothetical protein